MYYLYPNIVPVIKKKLRNSNLTLLTDEPKKLIQEKKRFFRAFCLTKNNEKVFFKSLLAKEKGIKNRFLNEINFLKTLKGNPQHPLNEFSPKILDFSLNPSFLYLIEEFLPGKTKKSKDRFSLGEIKEIAKLLQVINSSPFNFFKFVPEKPLFQFSLLKKRIDLFLKNIRLKKETEQKIRKFIQQNQKIVYNIKNRLSHGDFSEANIIFCKNKVKIIDWEHVHLRNPLYDFAEFWIKRRKNPKEQKILMGEFLKGFKDKKYFDELFKIALIEICLRDLNLFSRVIEGSKKSGENEKAEKYKNQFKNYLQILNKNLK